MLEEAGNVLSIHWNQKHGSEESIDVPESSLPLILGNRGSGLKNRAVKAGMRTITLRGPTEGVEKTIEDIKRAVVMCKLDTCNFVHDHSVRPGSNAVHHMSRITGSRPKFIKLAWSGQTPNLSGRTKLKTRRNDFFGEGQRVHENLHLVRLMWRSAFEPKSIFSRSSRLRQPGRAAQPIQMQSAEHNQVKRRTSIEAHVKYGVWPRPECAVPLHALKSVLLQSYHESNTKLDSLRLSQGYDAVGIPRLTSPSPHSLLAHLSDMIINRNETLHFHWQNRSKIKPGGLRLMSLGLVDTSNLQGDCRIRLVPSRSTQGKDKYYELRATRPSVSNTPPNVTHPSCTEWTFFRMYHWAVTLY